MYNGVGLSTPRGSGTSGYVERNLSSVGRGGRGEGRRYDDYTPNERPAEDNGSYGRRAPDQAILEHNEKRKIELECLDYGFFLEKQGRDPREIEESVNDLRYALTERALKKAGGNFDSAPAKRGAYMDSHNVSQAKQVENENFRRALLIEPSAGRDSRPREYSPDRKRRRGDEVEEQRRFSSAPRDEERGRPSSGGRVEERGGWGNEESGFGRSGAGRRDRDEPEHGRMGRDEAPQYRGGREDRVPTTSYRGGREEAPRGGRDEPPRGGRDDFPRGGRDEPPRGGRDDFPRGGRDEPPRGGRDDFPRGGRDEPPRGGRDGPRGGRDEPFSRGGRDEPPRGGRDLPSARGSSRASFDDNRGGSRPSAAPAPADDNPWGAAVEDDKPWGAPASSAPAATSAPSPRSPIRHPSPKPREEARPVSRSGDMDRRNSGNDRGNDRRGPSNTQSSRPTSSQSAPAPAAADPWASYAADDGWGGDSSAEKKEPEATTPAEADKAPETENATPVTATEKRNNDDWSYRETERPTSTSTSSGSVVREREQLPSQEELWKPLSRGSRNRDSVMSSGKGSSIGGGGSKDKENANRIPISNSRF